jgi:hypothetical protein
MTWPTQLSAEPQRRTGLNSRGHRKITTTVPVTAYEDLREDKPAPNAAPKTGVANAFMCIDA